MPVMRVLLDIESAEAEWPDIDREKVIHLGNDAPPMWVATLARGMSSGKPSIMIRLDLPDGRIVLAETSLALLLTAVDAMKGRHGDPRQ